MSKPINVIHIIDSLEVGGAEMMAVNIANGLASRGCESHLCVTRSEGLLKKKIDKKVHYLFLEKKGAIDVKAILRLKTYIKEHHIRIIHAHSSSFFIAALVKLLLINVKIVWHDHYGKAEEINERKSFAIKLGSFFFNAVISVNKILLHWAKEQLICKNITFLANFATLPQRINKTHLKGEVGKRLVCVAAFRPQKDHFNLLQAFNIINQKYPTWSLHLVGQKKNDVYSHQINEIIKNENIGESVFFYGACLDIKYVLSQADIAILSSNSEGLPVSLLEYGLAKLPVVVTNVGECKEVVNDFGLVVPKEDTKALAKAIERYIIDENFRELKAEQFQKHIFENYSEDSYFSKLLNIYQSC